MQTFLKSGNAKLYLYIGVLLVMTALWRVGDAINGRLAEMPVHAAPKVGSSAAILDKRSFSPVRVTPTSEAPTPVADVNQVESLFKHEEEKATNQTPAKPIEPDYGQIFLQTVWIDGVADNGLFINGRFYATGAKLEAFSMSTASGKKIVPKLEVIREGKAIFEVGAKKISISISGKP